MATRSKKVVLFLVLALSSVACEKKVIEKETVYRWEQSQHAPRNPQEQLGGIDSGGGNGVNGRPLESFRVDMLDDEIVAQNLIPLVEDLALIHEDLAADLMHILKHRMWYFVPVQLEKLSPLKIGVTFKIEDLGQIALQDSQEVWIDSTMFGEMEDQDKLRILIHELVMGVRLLEFSGPLDECLASAAKALLDGNDKRYLEQKDQCYKSHQWLKGSKYDDFLLGPRIRLNDKDYKSVRTLTNWIADDLGSLSPAQVESFLASMLKRRYQ